MRTRKPARTKERYILDSLISIFRGGHWVEDTVESVIGPENHTSTPYITVIGGQKYDEAAFKSHLGTLPQDTIAVMGEGRGAELTTERIFGELSQLIPVDKDLYGKNARKVNVEQVLCFAPDSPLLLVGNGERVKQAKSWLERTLSKREVIELP